MAYDVETQIVGMDVKHDTGASVARVRSTKFPFFKESSVPSGNANTLSSSSSKCTHMDNPVSNGQSSAVACVGHDGTSVL